MAITGGTITVVGSKTIHTFTADGNFVTDRNLTVDALVVGGGGGGGCGVGGGGGAGGAVVVSAEGITTGTYPVVVGPGGAGGVGAINANGTTGTWGTAANPSVGTTFVADKGPIMCTY